MHGNQSSNISRRRFLALGAAGAGAMALGGRSAFAQSLSGEITVQYQTRGGALEAAVNQAIQTIQTANPGAKINVAEAIGGAYETQLALQLNGGRGPDVFLMTSVLLAELADAKFVAPLDSYLNAWPDWSLFQPRFKENIPYNGSVWGLPYLLDTHFLYYRKDLFTQAGLPADWTPAKLDDVATAALTVKSALPDVIPYVLFAGANPGTSTAVRGFIPMVIANGGALLDGDGKWIIDSCAIREALAFYQRAYQTDKFTPQDVMSTVSATNAMRAAFGQGKAAILFDGCWAWDDWMKADPSLVDKIGFGLHPKADGSAPFTIGGFGNTWYMSAKAANADLAWAFIAAMNTKEVQIALNLDDLHVPSRQDAANDPSFLSTPFNQAMVASIDSAVIAKIDPNLRNLIGIIQKATGNVATGNETPEAAVADYGSELKRVLGDGNVVAQAC
jgi:multiple sugar transport system substrate-binding protein